ncbi:MAG: autotransporter-associated beta strand repeat-containing protein [Planctomycetota bacterium]
MPPRTTIRFALATLLIALALPVQALAEPDSPPEARDILLKPIPDKLVVLTFDDAPASHATVVTPILSGLGFGGSFYVCDFDSFRTRKDWYMTYRQMKAMADAGFEIGNHTLGHGGGLENYLRMEDQLISHHVPKPTTVCWPVYHAAPSIYQDLFTHGYTFGRGGHERPYRPTVDNPFDVPSFTIRDGVTVEAFARKARLARQGMVVVFCFHGVPDMEHPGVSLEPETFKQMMQYLKDNDYHCIALRDMAKYINPAQAIKLPNTVRDPKNLPPLLLNKDDKPAFEAVAKNIHEFAFPGLPPARIFQTAINLTVPYGTEVTALAPKVKVSPGASVVPESGVTRDFTKPQTYTVTGQDGSTKSYVVTVNRTAVSRAKELLTFTLPGAVSTAISRNHIAATVPTTTDVTALAPVFTLPPFATSTPESGTARDFTKPQSYTITAQDGSSQTVTVIVMKSDKTNAFTWSKADGGNWSDAAKWSNEAGSGTAPVSAGQSDYILSFNQGGSCTATNDLKAGFLLNQLVLGDRSGGLILSGTGLTFTKDVANNIPPVIHASKCQRVDINVPVSLQDDLTVKTSPDKDPNCFISFNEVISGRHSLILNSSGDSNIAGINFHDVHFGILQINNANTYSGGTIINGGKINVRKTHGLGTGPIIINNYGTLSAESNLANPVTINQGMLFHSTLSGPITLNGIAGLIGNCTISGTMSGLGGFTMFGRNGTYLSMVPGGTVTLQSANSYTGPTTVFPGTLIVKKAAGLYDGDPTKWTTANLTIHNAATLRLNVGGPGEFTGEHVSTLLRNLTRSVNENGLMGGSVLSLDTANASNLVTVSANIGDSSGPGGGAFLIRKCGPGAIQLSGNNTYTGQTILESGTLSVASLNSFTEGMRKPGSSLGVPMDIESGEIVIGEDGKDGECALIYTGTGETSDRVMNLAGKNSIVSFNQSGTGLFKFTSDLLISGYGANKTVVLRGDTKGTGEIEGIIPDPHDRTGKAKTAITKSDSGKWTLSGRNTFSGLMKVTQGTLCITDEHSLGVNPDIDIASGSDLELKFEGQVKIQKLTLDGKLQPPGMYGSATSPVFLRGTGILKVQP